MHQGTKLVAPQKQEVSTLVVAHEGQEGSAPALTHGSQVTGRLSGMFPDLHSPGVLKRKLNHEDSTLHFWAMEFLDGLANFNAILIRHT